MKAVSGIMGLGILISVVFDLTGCSRIHRFASGQQCMVPDSAIQAASEARGLPLLYNVPCRVEKPEAVKRFIREEFKESSPVERLKYEGTVYQILGLIPADYPLVESLVELYTKRLAGYYNPRIGEFVAVAGIDGAERELVYVHELTHALQDQHFNLQRLITKELTNDQALARMALFEGDAMLTEARYQRTFDCDQYTANAVANDISRRLSNTGEIPPAINLLVSFPYIYGRRYVCALLSSGGQEMVNTAFTSPPGRTRSILHLDLNDLGDRDPRGKYHRAGWIKGGLRRKPLFSDELGEFTLLSLLVANDAARLPDSARFEELERVAAGWQSDRLFYFGEELPETQGGVKRPKLVWRIRAKNRQSAETLWRNLSCGLRLRFPEQLTTPTIESQSGKGPFTVSDKRFGTFVLRKLGQTVELVVR